MATMHVYVSVTLKPSYFSPLISFIKSMELFFLQLLDSEDDQKRSEK